MQASGLRAGGPLTEANLEDFCNSSPQIWGDTAPAAPQTEPVSPREQPSPVRLRQRGSSMEPAEAACGLTILSPASKARLAKRESKANAKLRNPDEFKRKRAEQERNRLLNKKVREETAARLAAMTDTMDQTPMPPAAAAAGEPRVQTVQPNSDNTSHTSTADPPHPPHPPLLGDAEPHLHLPYGLTPPPPLPPLPPLPPPPTTAEMADMKTVEVTQRLLNLKNLQPPSSAELPHQEKCDLQKKLARTEALLEVAVAKLDDQHKILDHAIHQAGQVRAECKPPGHKPAATHCFCSACLLSWYLEEMGKGRDDWECHRKLLGIKQSKLE